MIKHILTLSCPRHCHYCIVQGVPRSEPRPDRIPEVYRILADQGAREIMLTGGEPLEDLGLLQEALSTGRTLLGDVHLTTAERDFQRILDWRLPFFASITLSLHEQAWTAPFIVRAAETPAIYAAIMAEQYADQLPAILEAAGYAGLTINEEQRPGFVQRFDEEALPDLGTAFTYKVNRVGHCMRETILLPDLSACTDFKKFFDGRG